MLLQWQGGQTQGAVHRGPRSQAFSGDCRPEGAHSWKTGSHVINFWKLGYVHQVLSRVRQGAVFGLGSSDWSHYDFLQDPGSAGHQTLLYLTSHSVNIKSPGYDSLPTSKPQFSAIRFPHSLPSLCITQMPPLSLVSQCPLPFMLLKTSRSITSSTKKPYQHVLDRTSDLPHLLSKTQG
jgi:hypothetical protein